MKKTITAIALATTFGMSTSVLAESPIDPNYPGTHADSRMIMLEVEKMPTVQLGGSVFEQPTMPTLEQLESGQPTALGDMHIMSSAGMCSLSITTDNDFALQDPSNGMMLSKYMLEYGGNGTVPMPFDANAQGPMSMDCMASTGGMLHLMPTEYDATATGGLYSDVVHVHVEVAG